MQCQLLNHSSHFITLSVNKFPNSNIITILWAREPHNPKRDVETQNTSFESKLKVHPSFISESFFGVCVLSKFFNSSSNDSVEKSDFSGTCFLFGMDGVSQWAMWLFSSWNDRQVWQSRQKSINRYITQDYPFVSYSTRKCCRSTLSITFYVKACALLMEEFELYLYSTVSNDCCSEKNSA